MSKCPACAAAWRSASVCVGVEPGFGFLDQPAQLGRADGVREGGDHGVHERRGVRWEAQGAVGDEPQPPRRQLTGLEPGPAVPEPVVALDGVGEVAAPGLGGPPQRGGELGDRELRDLRAALAAQRETGLVPLIDRPDQRVDRVHRRPPGRGPHHLPGGVVLDPLLGPRVAQHGGGVVAVLDRGRLNGRGHRGTHPATGHRQSEGVGTPLWTRGSGVGGVEAKWTIWLAARGRVPAAAAVISTSSIGGARAGAFAAVISTGSISGARAGAFAAVISTSSIGGGRAGAFAAVISTGSIGGGRAGAFAAVISTSSISGGTAGAFAADPTNDGGAASPPAATRQPALLWPSPGLSPRPGTERRHPRLTAPVRARHSAVGLTTYPTKIATESRHRLR